MDKGKFLENLSILEGNLTALTYETCTKEIKNELQRNFFALIKVTGSFDEYLDQINEVNFKPLNFGYNKGHHKDREAFSKAKCSLLSILDIIKREVAFGKLDNITLLKPDTISIPWLWNNMPARFWVYIAGILISVILTSFGLGLGLDL